MAVGAPSLNELGLERHGLQWCWPEVDLAHPLDGGGAGVMLRSLADTRAGLGADGSAWERVFGSSARGFAALSEDIMRPILHVPRHPLRAGALRHRSGAAGDRDRTHRSGARRRRRCGAAAPRTRPHPLSRPMSASIGMALICAGHRYGWPVARGGSRAISGALAAVVREHGGRIETGRRVSSLAELPRADAVVLDLAPGAVARDRR